ncbi:FAP278 [Auxenochlorella protothecoides x Auxenochlorella symbiontica]
MAGLQGVLLGMGNPLLDISAVVDQALLDKYKLKLGNQILAEEEHLPLFKELTDEHKPEFIAGGATQNSIRIAQWMLQVSWRHHLHGLSGEGRVRQHPGRGRRQGWRAGAVPCRPGGAHRHLRRLHCWRGALPGGQPGRRQQLQDRPPAQAGELGGGGGCPCHLLCRLLHHRVPRLDAEGGPARRRQRQAVRAQHLRALHRGGAALPRRPQPAPALRRLPGFGNETEARAYAAAAEWGTEDVEEIALRISRLPKENGARPRTVIFTQGADPTVVAVHGKVALFPVVRLPAEKLVDTNGAGDSFVGGFLSQLVAGKGVEEGVRAGHYAASIVVQRSGCTFPDLPYNFSWA